MKHILGLDLGTNSIGWAVVNAAEQDDNKQLKPVGIVAAGSRILPMDAAILGKFNSGNSVPQTAERTGFRGARRLYERNILRRERLLRVLNLLEFLPPHYAAEVDRYGHFTEGTEPKIAWKPLAEGKYEFVYQEAFQEMLQDFRTHQPQLFYRKPNGEETRIPYDWTLYYLRKKALTQPVTPQEFAWILLSFNQKRGYYQLRGEDEEETSNKQVEYCALKVTAVEDSGEKKGDSTWYNVHLENGWIYRRTSKVPLDWVGKTKEFIATTDLDDKGEPKKDKEGQVKRSLRAPGDNDWMLVKKKTEYNIEQTHETVGQYIYHALLANPDQKIRGKLVRTIERKFYKAELKQILETQCKFIAQLQSRELYEACLNELYSSNTAYRNSIAKRDFVYLFMDDIILYQRPLKSKKSLIDDCPYETRMDKDGTKYPVKCIAQSHPLFQELRLWQFVSNLRILQRTKEVNGKLKTDVDVTNEFLQTEDDYTALYEWLNARKEVEQKALIVWLDARQKERSGHALLPKIKGKDAALPYRWNYVDKPYPCNTTRALIVSRLDKAGIALDFLTPEIEERLWHLLYSVSAQKELEQALHTFAKKHHLEEPFVAAFKKCPPFEKNYGAYSAKAIGKLLPLMRMGEYWAETAIDAKTRGRIDKIITGEYDEGIRERVREKAIALTDVEHFRALPLWLACYVVYDRHSESQEVAKWETPADMDVYVKNFKQHSLRNPIVEQVILETLRTVRDIWAKVGKIDEIHLELGREMKNPANERASMMEKNIQNENANLRIKAMLCEFVKPEYHIEGVRPYSAGQQDILRIYEDYAVSNLHKDDNEYDFISKVSKTAQPTAAEVVRYKLWLEQKYRSPYTGEIIPLGKLFTSAYEIEHVIPQSRYFDNSFSNKVICEAEVNKLKDNSLGYEFITEHHGENVALGFGQTVEIFSVEAYEKFVKEHYGSNHAKMKKLLLDDIPDNFIERQMNDSRYISKVVKDLLSNVVREQGEQDAISKNLIVCTGGITDYLKKDWGMNDVWNSIVLPRFKRLAALTGRQDFVTINTSGHEIPAMPLELQKGFNKKRIDHRHHAMDAIVIACATRNHVNLLNNEAAKSENRAMRYQLSRKLRRYEKVEIVKNGEHRQIDVAKEFLQPWDTFTTDAQRALDNIVVSFKQNTRIINKTTNKYQHYQAGKKVLQQQTKGERWAIRKPLHKDTVFGEVNLRKIKTTTLNECLKNVNAVVDKTLKAKIKELVNGGYDAKKLKKYFTDNADVWTDVNLAKIPVYYYTKDTADRFFATRKPLDTGFDQKTIEGGVTDTGIEKILLKHLQSYDNNSELAFSADGIEEMNRNIVALNGGVPHKPIYKVRWYEQADKFAVGKRGNKGTKFVEAAKGTNLFFAVYQSTYVDKETGEQKHKRSFATIPLNIAIERKKQGLPEAPATDEQGNPLLFVLSPGDLVYLPNSVEEIVEESTIDKQRIYKFIDSSGTTANFIPHSVANVLFSMTSAEQQKRNIQYSIQDEYGMKSPQSKNQRAITGEMIKEICVPLTVNRLGEIQITRKS